jgi:hypothetical protein
MIIATFILVATYWLDLNLFDLGFQAILHLESDKFDETVSAIFVIILGWTLDHLRARRKARQLAEMDAQRLRVLHSTMRTVLDLFNNFLNNMQLFRLEAEESPLSVESLKLFDDLIFETADKLKALGNSDSVVEYEMANGPGIQPAGLTRNL